MFWLFYIKLIEAVAIFPINKEQSICEWQHCPEQNLRMSSSRLHFAPESLFLCAIRNGTKWCGVYSRFYNLMETEQC